MRGRLVTLGGGAALVLAAVLTGLQPAGATQTRAARTGAAQWHPEPAVYGVSQPVTIPVTMDDGVVLSTQVIYPTIPSTGARAPGKFPVLLTQNPYGTAQNPVAAGDYYVQRGYIYVAASIRGTGASGGQLSWFGQRQGEDGAELVSWAAHTLAGSDGKVGLDGCSYLGVDQWFTAAADGRNSALKVIAPFCTDSDFYNDLTADGGIPTPFVAGIGQAEPRGPQEPVTGRYQAIIGPWTHGENVTGPILDALKLEWFDTWLKGEPTGWTHTLTPLHIFENNASQWVDSAAWPPSPATQTYYLGDTSLTAARPAGPGSDSLAWAAASTSTTLTYTTAPLTRSVVLDGPSDVTIYATSSGPETEITATLNVVAPNGTVTKLRF